MNKVLTKGEPAAPSWGSSPDELTYDGLEGHWVKAALAQGLGVVSGGQLRPNDPNTRAEAAVMLYHLLDR